MHDETSPHDAHRGASPDAATNPPYAQSAPPREAAGEGSAHPPQPEFVPAPEAAEGRPVPPPQQAPPVVVPPTVAAPMTVPAPQPTTPVAAPMPVEAGSSAWPPVPPAYAYQAQPAYPAQPAPVAPPAMGGSPVFGQLAMPAYGHTGGLPSTQPVLNAAVTSPLATVQPYASGPLPTLPADASVAPGEAGSVTASGPGGHADEAPRSGGDEPAEGALHRRHAAMANNSVWDILDQPQPWLADTLDDVLERAYAAAYHWRRAHGGSPENKARAAWLIARVHAFAAAQCLGHADLAYHHAAQCMAIVTAADLRDFDRAYAHEAVARAAAACGLLDNAADHRARSLQVPIAVPGDQAQFQADLVAGPWFGLPPLAAPAPLSETPAQTPAS